MIAMTTKSSIRVKPRRVGVRFVVLLSEFLSDRGQATMCSRKQDWTG